MGKCQTKILISDKIFFFNILEFFKSFFGKEPHQKAFKKQLNNVLGFTPGDVSLYKTALSHRSIREGADENNER
jgi:ribonuclease-3